MFLLSRVICRQTGFFLKNSKFCGNFKPFNLQHFSIVTTTNGKRRRIVDSSDEENNTTFKSPIKKKLVSPTNKPEKKANSPVNKKSKTVVKEERESTPEKPTPKKNNTASSGKKSKKVSPVANKKSIENEEEEEVSPEPETKMKLEKSEEPLNKIKEIRLQTPGKGAKGVDYDPLKSKYHPINDAFWNKGEK